MAAAVVGRTCAAADARTGRSICGGAIHAEVRVDALVERPALQLAPVAGFDRGRTRELGFVNVYHKVVRTHGAGRAAAPEGAAAPQAAAAGKPALQALT
jgi:hypothetical protein